MAPDADYVKVGTPFTSFRACPEPVEGAGSSRAPGDRRWGRPWCAQGDI